MSKYYSINEFSRILGMSAQTLRNWDKNNKLKPHRTSANGCRVSSHKQKDDLERQIEKGKRANKTRKW